MMFPSFQPAARQRPDPELSRQLNSRALILLMEASPLAADSVHRAAPER